ncbi:type I-E CRISPR-associated protein Cse2/CasB [Roseibium sp. RKSG952]|uniref:type I-E CRISPR-associated protein Cse2/CasB n=1 Tax=Roseibium sp. RKSG952 TaxID=2529384 RepID=UPI0012BCE5D3|nr:type I-E CRISPR-associated protein Cse2/CasB [Roseibium sp. RKSG952]MTH95645.1 type I-E CRISPR-associated protein Cse2/CasB [Roseibium sp. RKSG952]
MSSEDKKEPSPFISTVGRMIAEFERGFEGKSTTLSRGDISTLRRMDTKTPAVSFWKLMAAVSDDATPKGRWELVAKAMAIMSPHIHQNGVNPGQALRDVGFSARSDLRISRLLKAEGDPFEDYLISAVRFLANKGRPVNWFRFAEFVFYQNTEAKNRLARDFYSLKKG